MYPMIVLKEGKEFSPKNGHPWIFSGAIADVPDLAKSGDLVRVIAHDGSFVGMGTFSRTSSIAVRVFTRHDEKIDETFITKKIQEADQRRHLLSYNIGNTTTGYRMVFGESDGLPGIIIDRYSDVFVIQTATLGASNLLPLLTSALQKTYKPRLVLEKSDSPVRKEDGLHDVRKVLAGTDSDEAAFMELGVTCIADLKHGQKTGFFLDQKDLRQALRHFAKGDILNVFSYTGITTINALMNPQAKQAINVDASQEALDLCVKHAEMNGIAKEKMATHLEDAFQYLTTSEQMFDTVIIDPPALIKSSKDAEEGKKAYHFLNRAALRKVKNGGIFVTSSCSRQFSEEDLLMTLRKAATQNGQELHILASIGQASDHPYSVNFPEARYLKSLICTVQKKG